MEIKNNVTELITLSIAKTQTIQYWALRIVEVMQMKRKSDFRIDKVELISSKDLVLDESVFHAIAQIDKNHSLIVCLDKSIVNYYVFEDVNKSWDEFDYSIASSSLNDLISHIQLKPHYQFKNVNECNALLNLSERIQLKFKTTFNQNTSYINVLLNQNVLENFLQRYHDPKSKNLEAMMDVPITVRVELGNLSRKVKEIIEFTQGTLLELDQTINSSCKVIVNNHVIAQGDVVEVNGNFGVVMTKIDDKVDFMK